MKKNKLKLPISSSSSDVHPQAEHLVQSIMADFAKQNPVLSTAISKSLISPNQRKAAVGYKILLHGKNTPKFNWSSTRHDPETQTIHVWTDNLDPQTLTKNLHDSLMRAAFHNIANIAYNGHHSIKNDLKNLSTKIKTTAKPLSSNEMLKRIQNTYMLKHHSISQIKKSLRDLQKAAYSEKDLHDKRTQKKLNDNAAEHAEGMHSPGINGIAVKHFKLISNLTSPHTPHILLEKRVMRSTKTPKTSLAATKLFKTLKDHLSKL